MNSLLQVLQSVPAELLAATLIELDKTRPGTAYDVGVALYEADVGKEVPGPDPYANNYEALDVGSVNVTGFDLSREADAIEAFREIWGHKIPTFDENDQKWLSAPSKEKKAARQAAETWANRDQVPSFISILKNSNMEVRSMVCRQNFQPGAPQSYAEAEIEVARFATYGVQASISGYKAPAASHRVSLRQLSRGAIG